MSTRSNIAFYASTKDRLDKFEAMLYRHSDGYPGAPLQKGVWGVLPEMLPVWREFAECRGNDPEYMAAYSLFVMKFGSLKDVKRAFFHTEEKEKAQKLLEHFSFDMLGHGICNVLHGDIEYFYAVYPDRVKVFVPGPYKKFWDASPDKAWRYLKQIGVVKFRKIKRAGKRAKLKIMKGGVADDTNKNRDSKKSQ